MVLSRLWGPKWIAAMLMYGAGLRHHLEDIRHRHERDLISGGGYVRLPEAIARKYPDANRQWGWHGSSPHIDSSRIRKRDISTGITCTKPSSNVL